MELLLNGRGTESLGRSASTTATNGTVVQKEHLNLRLFRLQGVGELILTSVEKFLENPTDVWAAEFIDAIDLDDPSICLPIFVPFEGVLNALPDLFLSVFDDNSLFFPCLSPLTPSLLAAFRDRSSFMIVVHSAIGAFAPFVVQMPCFKQSKIEDLIFL